MTRVDVRECPPRSKKLSASPTRSTPNASCQIRASNFSVVVRGALYLSIGANGSRSEVRMIRPSASTSSASISTNCCGTRSAGRFWRAKFRTAPRVVYVAKSGRKYATNRNSSLLSRKLRTTTWPTIGHAPSTFSTAGITGSASGSWRGAATTALGKAAASNSDCRWSGWYGLTSTCPGTPLRNTSARAATPSATSTPSSRVRFRAGDSVASMTSAERRKAAGSGRRRMENPSAIRHTDPCRSAIRTSKMTTSCWCGPALGRNTT